MSLRKPTYEQPTQPLYGWRTLSGSIITSEEYQKYITAVDLSENDAVFVSQDNNVHKTSIDSLTSSLIVGFSNSAANSGSLVAIKQQRILKNFTNLSVGKKYYLSESLGKISQEPPKNKNNFIVEVGIAQSSSVLFFEPTIVILL